MKLSDRYSDNLESYRLLVESVKDYAIFMLDQQGFIVTWNIGAQRIKGYTAEEIIGQHFSRFYTEQDNALHLPDEELILAAAEGKWEGEGWRLRKDGSRFWANVVITSLWRDGNLVGFAKVTRDMTQQKEHRDALEKAKESCERLIEQRTLELHQREDMLRSAFEQAAIAISYTPLNGFLQQVNQKFGTLVGYSKEELASMKFVDITHPEDRASILDNLDRLRGGDADSFSAETRIRHKDGDVVWANVTCSMVRDIRTGQPKNLISFVEDISWRKQAEKALRDSEAMFRTMTNAVPQMVWSARPDGHLDYCNDQWYEFTGMPEGSTDGDKWMEICHPDDRERTKRVWRHSLDTGKRYDIEYRLRHRSGQYRWTLGRALPVRDEKGVIVRWMGTCTDIHEQKTTQDALRRSEQRFRLLYENAPIGIAHIDLEGHWTYANHKFAEITGYTPEEIVGLGHLDVPLAEERAIGAELMEKMLAGEFEIHRERRILRKDRSASWIRLTARMLQDESGKPQYGITIFEDINERKQAEAALRDSEERFRATFENAPLGIGKTSLDGVFIRANPKLLEILGYTLEEFTRLSIVEITHPADREQTIFNFQNLVSGQTSSYISEKRFIRKDGSFVWMNITTALRYIDEVPQYVIGIFEDVTARKRAEEDLRRALEQSYHLANHDALTGLANRASFNDRLQDALNYAKRDGHIVAVHLLDLDRFKTINDTLGHHIGDLLLKEVANRIQSQTRATDVVARLGGDEFVIIQTHLAAPFAASILAQKIVDELGRPFVLEKQEVHSGASIGIAIFPNDAEDPEDLVKLADMALYEAKSRGRHDFRFYRHEMSAAVEEAQQLEQELRHALREGQFRLHYQPQFDLKSKRISGIEALIRWQHPEKGLLTAAEFIRDAENTSLTPLIGEWTLSTACRQHKKWVNAGLAVPLILNVSLQQLRHPRFLRTLRKILEETELPPSMVQLETSESVLWDPKLSMSLLTELKNIGVRLALDNFGTELAALSSLYRFPLDVVKPGRSLVKKVPHREQEAAVLSAVVSVAHEMKIAVCAEGIETADELTAVKKHGCDAAQGFHLNSPVSESEMDRLIEAELSH